MVKEINKYRNARFLVQSILLLSPDSNTTFGKLYVKPVQWEHSFRHNDTSSKLVDIVLFGGSIGLKDDTVNDPILKAILPKISIEHYDKNVPSQKGVLQGLGHKALYADWGSEFEEEVRRRGEYLVFTRYLRINPEEFGQKPVKNEGAPTVGFTPGSNVVGHYHRPRS